MIKQMAQPQSFFQVRFTQLRQSILLRLQNRLFWRNSGLLLLANVIVTGLGLIRTPVMTWMLPKNEVGMMGVIASWMPFLNLLSLSSLDSAAYHYVAKGQPWAFVINMGYRLRWSLLSTVGLLGGAVYWIWKGDSLLAWMFIIAGISYPFTSGMTAAAGMLGAQRNFTGLFWYRIFESLTDFTGFIPLAFSSWWITKVVTFYTGNQIATAFMQVGISFWLAWQLKKVNTPRMSKEDEREMVRYGKHLNNIAAIAVLQTRSDALIIGSLLPLETMADYTIALLIYDQFKRLWVIYTTIRYPPLVNMTLARRQQRMVIEGGVIFIGFIGLGLVISLFAHWLIPIVLPPNYANSLVYIDLLILSFIGLVPGALAEIYFRTIQSEKQQYLLRLTGASVGIVASIALFFPWGAYGVAFGRFLANSTMSALGIWLFVRELKLKQPR